jgi:hypothetical protein
MRNVLMKQTRLSAVTAMLAAVPAAMLAGGCATQDALKPDSAPAVQACLGAKQCDAMWHAARWWVLTTCRYPIDKDTADLIETFNTVYNTVPRQVSTALACRVTRTSRAEGGFAIGAMASCSAIGPAADPCYPPVKEALAEFRRAMEKAAEQVKS